MVDELDMKMDEIKDESDIDLKIKEHLKSLTHFE
jgi:hypothetical protein